MSIRNLIITLVGLAIVPVGIMSAQPQRRPMKPQLHIPAPKVSQKSECRDCKKCGRACKCDCKKSCKCKPGCCKADRPSPRGFDGRTPNFQPPRSKPTRGFDGRTPSFGPPSRSRSSSDSPSRSRSSSDNRSPDRESRYKEIISKFDKNNDGKLDEKEREAIREYMKQRIETGKSK